MSKEQIEKQAIEEMARDIFECKVAIDGIDIAFAAVHGADKEDSNFMRIAKHLVVNKGYRKQSEGEWADQYQGKYDNQLYKCSECGETAFNDEKRWLLTHYCPNCGARMKGGE